MQHELIGRTVGSYFLVERLGAGGMSSVYRARRSPDNFQVAIKILPIHLAANDTLRRRFMREAETAQRLQYPHILPITDFGEEDGIPYLVMKLVDGGTLKDRIAREPLPLRQVARILDQIARALDYAHEQGVIHRDLKPENILFDRQDTAYLADFGIARLHESAGELTDSGGFLGTAAYASPEQCRGESCTAASDIYSLGVVLYEMLTGVLPFQGSTPLAIMHQHISEPPPNPLKHRPELPVEITDVLRKTLAKIPAVRYQSAIALSTAVNRTLSRALGTNPLAENAPPLGPNPVFNKPPTAYTPPPIPDELLRDVSPSRPSRPVRLDSLRMLEPVPPDPQGATTEAASINHTSITIFLLLVALFAIIAVIALITTMQ